MGSASIRLLCKLLVVFLIVFLLDFLGTVEAPLPTPQGSPKSGSPQGSPRRQIGTKSPSRNGQQRTNSRPHLERQTTFTFPQSTSRADLQRIQLLQDNGLNDPCASSEFSQKDKVKNCKAWFKALTSLTKAARPDGLCQKIRNPHCYDKSCHVVPFIDGAWKATNLDRIPINVCIRPLKVIQAPPEKSTGNNRKG